MPWQLKTHKYTIYDNSSSKLSDTNKYNLNELHDDCSVKLLLRNWHNLSWKSVKRIIIILFTKLGYSLIIGGSEDTKDKAAYFHVNYYVSIHNNALFINYFMHNTFCAACFVIYIYALCQGVLLDYAQQWTWLYKSYFVVIHVQLTKVTGNCQYTNYCIQVADLHHVPVWTQQKLLLQNTTMIFDNTIIFI